MYVWELFRFDSDVCARMCKRYVNVYDCYWFIVYGSKMCSFLLSNLIDLMDHTIVVFAVQRNCFTCPVALALAHLRCNCCARNCSYCTGRTALSARDCDASNGHTSVHLGLFCGRQVGPTCNQSKITQCIH